MPQIEVWKTSDGQIFETKKEHDDHESRLNDELIVENFISAREWKSGAQSTRARNLIMDFLDWKNRPEMDTTKEAAAA